MVVIINQSKTEAINDDNMKEGQMSHTRTTKQQGHWG
jgi:hypothetical protein